jgi:hypothetical protein
MSLGEKVWMAPNFHVYLKRLGRTSNVLDEELRDNSRERVSKQEFFERAEPTLDEEVVEAVK